MNSKGLAQLAYEKGMYVLTAAQGYQAALEAAQLGHGYLTYALVVEGLKTPRADKSPRDGQVMVREWLDYATERVPQMQQTKIEPLLQSDPVPQRPTGKKRPSRQQGQQSQPKRKLIQAPGNTTSTDLARENDRVQRPRVFYRREPEAHPMIVSRP